MRAGICTAEEREKCEAEFGENPEGLDWACENCPKCQPAKLHAYTHKLLQLRALKVAGYPFEANDLTVEEWLDLGRLEQQLEAPKNKT